MMRVAICDDELSWVERSKQILLDYGKCVGLELEVCCFSNSEELLGYTGEPLDVVFQDIVLQEENGIAVAAEINGKWKNCQIVFVTNHLYFATDVYATEHIFFVVKEQFEAKVPEVFHKLLHEMEQNQEQLVFHLIGGNEVVLNPADILYFERNRRITKVQTVWGTYEVWDKLDEILPRLSALDFVRCHNSYITYFPAVREMQKDSFLLNNNQKIMISRSYQKGVKQSFAKWAVTQIS